MNEILMIGGAIVGLLVFIGFIFARLYKRATKGLAFVRTGMGGQKVVLDGGALVLPILHDTIDVNMNTLRLDVTRAREQALITKDRMRVDVNAEFYVRVKPTAEAIATAAQTLGAKTLDSNALRQITEAKFVDALRSCGSSMNMEELHEKRADFVQIVQQAVTADLEKNGLELESVSLTGLDQTDVSYFNENNAFDATGLAKLTETIEEKRKVRNEVEQLNRVAIAQRNLEAEQQTLEIQREAEYARLQQEREINIRRAEQSAEIKMKEADRQREAEQAEIEAKREVDLKRILAEKQVEEQQILKQQQIQQAAISQQKAVELAQQEKQIAVSEKSQEESEAKRKADEARVAAVQAEEQVITARDTEIAERAKKIEIIEAQKIAEKDAVGIKVQAEAEKEAAENLAEAKRIEAQGEKDAEIARAEGRQTYYDVEATGKEKLNNAQNILNSEQVQMAIRLKLLEVLPQVIAESVKPMENIDSVKIVQMNGQPFGGGAVGTAGVVGASNQSLPEQFVNAGLQYRACAPLVDDLMKEVGLNGGSLQGMVNAQDLLGKGAETPVAAEPTVAATNEAAEPTTETADAYVNGQAHSPRFSQEAQHD